MPPPQIESLMKTICVILFGVLSMLACSSTGSSKSASATCSSDSECSSGALATKNKLAASAR